MAKKIEITVSDAKSVLNDLHEGMHAIESWIRTGDVEFNNTIVNNVLTSIQLLEDELDKVGEGY